MPAANARPVPAFNVRFRLTFDWRKNDGTLLASAAGIVSQYSLDGAAFANTNNSVTQIGTSGVYYIDLMSTEMNANTVVFLATSTSTNALPVTIILYPADIYALKVNIVAISSDTGSLQAQYETLAFGVVQCNVDSTNLTPTTTQFDASFGNMSTNTATDYFKGRTVLFSNTTTGGLSGQASRISGSSFATPFCRITVSPPLTAAPATGSRFYIM